MALFDQWRKARGERKKAQAFVDILLREPLDDDVRWLASIATKGDEDHARWELRYARRGVGLLVAQRDALDDHTGSLVADTLSGAFESDPRIDPERFDLFERQFNARVSAYRDAFGARGADATARLGQTLLAFAGGSFRDVDDRVRRASDIVASYDREANEALRTVFGTAALPENVPPSAVAGSSSK